MELDQNQKPMRLRQKKPRKLRQKKPSLQLLQGNLKKMRMI